MPNSDRYFQTLLPLHNPHVDYMLDRVVYRLQILADIQDTAVRLQLSRQYGYISDHNKLMPFMLAVGEIEKRD